MWTSQLPGWASFSILCGDGLVDTFASRRVGESPAPRASDPPHVLLQGLPFGLLAPGFSALNDRG